MKTRERLTLFLCLFILPYAGMTQCGTIHKLINDTTVSGTGSAYPGYSFNMPKFTGSLGTLINVQIVSVVTVNYSYSIENRDTSAGYKTTRVKVNRYDEISGPSFDTVSNFFSPTTTYSLPPSDGVSGSGPDFRSIPPYYILNHDSIIKMTVNNTADYIGTGNVGFNYITDLGSQVSGNVNVNLSGSATDLIKFSVIYTYCDNVLLASEITSFSASKKDDYVNLHWLTSNETPGGAYEVQKSNDGKNFVSLATVEAKPNASNAGDYEYNYVPQSTEKGTLYFRIKQIANGGDSKYSPVRIVDLGTSAKKGDIRLIPNPSNGAFSIVLTDNAVASDWTIELFNIKGQVISRKQAMNSTLAKFSMNESLQAGVYFVLVTNKKNNQKFVERMIVN